MYDSQISRGFDSAQLQKNKEVASQVKVKPEMCFTGFDAYKKVIDALRCRCCSRPRPHFRPMHLKAAIEAGKHVFAERSRWSPSTSAGRHAACSRTAKKAKEKNLRSLMVASYCYRYEFAKRETVKRIHDGAIGDVSVIHCNYITHDPGRYHVMKEAPETMEYQMKNWYYFTYRLLTATDHCRAALPQPRQGGPGCSKGKVPPNVVLLGWAVAVADRIPSLAISSTTTRSCTTTRAACGCSPCAGRSPPRSYFWRRATTSSGRKARPTS